MSRSRGLAPAYGVDAPGLVRAMFLAGASSLSLAAALGALLESPWARPMALLAAVPSAYFLPMGCFMLHSSLVGKIRGREALLDLVPWSGREDVLDVGCGRGLMLVGAARRLNPGEGRAVGVDIWSAKDQGGNGPEAALENARREGVEGRVEVRTADMRRLPFPDRSFDAILSHWAVHNLDDEADRTRALAEMDRVLRPGGFLVLADIGNHDQYASGLAGLGFLEVRHVGSRWKRSLLAVLTVGSFRPAATVARKATA